MGKLRITNNAKGERGVYIAGELIFIGAGRTRTFSNATAEEVAVASASKEFRVQSGEEGAWEELSYIDMPEQRPFLVIATDSTGANFRRVPLNEGEWFIGTALSSDAPDTAEGYTYTKIGGTTDAPLTEKAAVASHEFDALSYLDQNGNTVIASLKDKSPEVLEALLAAERSDDGKKRKGVIAALEELLTEPAAPDAKD